MDERDKRDEELGGEAWGMGGEGMPILPRTSSFQSDLY